MMKQVWLIASGKGGVGKSSLATALGQLLAEARLRTLIIDADVGLRSVDMMLGLENNVLFEMLDCTNRRAALDEAIVAHPTIEHLSLLVAGQQGKPKDFASKDLKKMLSTLRHRFDHILIDAPAGIGRGLNNWLGLCDQYMLVTTPDPVSLRDVEKTAGIVFEKTGEHPWLIINRFPSQGRYRPDFVAPQDLASTLDMSLLGVIPDSARVYGVSLSGRGMLDARDKAVTLALMRVTRRMRGLPEQENRNTWFSGWWGRRRTSQ